MNLSIYLSFFLSIHPSICLSRIRQLLNLITSKRINSARLPLCSKLATSKTKPFCKTSFNSGKLSAELTAWYQCVLRFFQSIWQHRKRSNSARLPSKMESWVQSWWPRTNAFCDFCAQVLRLPRKSEARSYEVLHLSRKIILANLKISCSKMQPGPCQEISALIS